MNNIQLSPLAISDLVNIYDYILEESIDPKAARKTLDMIISDYAKLKENPYLGFSLRDKILFDCDYRALACKKYLIFYKIINNQIFISRILDSRRDYLKLLFNK